MPRKGRSRVSLRVGVETGLVALFGLPPCTKPSDKQVNDLLEFVLEEFAANDEGAALSKKRFWMASDEKSKSSKPRSKEAVWQAHYRERKKRRLLGDKGDRDLHADVAEHIGVADVDAEDHLLPEPEDQDSGQPAGQTVGQPDGQPDGQPSEAGTSSGGDPV